MFYRPKIELQLGLLGAPWFFHSPVVPLTSTIVLRNFGFGFTEK
jgi:hypothetical protein